MKLHIIIPYHGEPRERWFPLLNSINSQTNINFNDMLIYICRSDGEAEFPDTQEFNNISDRIIFLSQPCEYSGPGISRQIAVDYLLNEYYPNLSDTGQDGIIYCDCDDYLDTSNAISMLQSYMGVNDYNVLVFTSHQSQDGIISVVEPCTQSFSVWSKIYRVKAIKQYNIQFSKRLVSNEDFYYNYCFDSLYPLNKYLCPDSYYTWYRRNDSISSEASNNFDPDKYLKDHIIMWEDYKNWRQNYSTSSMVFYPFAYIVEALLSFLDYYDDSSEATALMMPVLKEYLEIVKEFEFNATLLFRTRDKLEYVFPDL